jgi:leucyl-tRNA synthetase
VSQNKAYTGDGVLINSDFLNGLPVCQAIEKTNHWLKEKRIGDKKITYKLRDWVFSRQRYWGEPIPVIHCKKCGTVPVPEKELPLELPPLKKFKPTGTGESPLANAKDWVDTKCPKCKGSAKRETNTMPQWAGSCWYYLRYIDSKNKSELCSKNLEKLWMPVDCYIGGTEHAVLHLLYARFWHKVLYDIGAVSTLEPFKKLRHQGMILSFSYRSEDGVYHPHDKIDFSVAEKPVLLEAKKPLTEMVEKMSKSKKNIVNPDDIIDKYGADTFRMYEMFMGPFESSKPWDMKGIEGLYRFLKRIWLWACKLIEQNKISAKKMPEKLEVLMNEIIYKVTSDIENLKFNTAISALMIYFNEMSKCENIDKTHFENFLTILHPMAPHITEELWQKAGNKDFLANIPWPKFDLKMLAFRDIDIVVQVNGKLRDKITIKAQARDEEIKSAALASDKIKKYTANGKIVKTIIVPHRLINIVVKGV